MWKVPQRSKQIYLLKNVVNYFKRRCDNDKHWNTKCLIAIQILWLIINCFPCEPIAGKRNTQHSPSTPLCLFIGWHFKSFLPNKIFWSWCGMCTFTVILLAAWKKRDLGEGTHAKVGRLWDGKLENIHLSVFHSWEQQLTDGFVERQMGLIGKTHTHKKKLCFRLCSDSRLQ